MNSCELVTLVSFLSCLISNSYEDEELAVLAAVFTQLGDSLATILANKDLYDNSMTIVKNFTNLDENIKNHFVYTPYLMYFEEGTLKGEVIGDNIKNELKTFLENNKIEKN